MTAVKYELVALGQVSAGVSSGTGNVQHAHTVIPGTTLRGALAAAWWRDRRQDFDKDIGDIEAQQRLDSLFERDLIIRQAVPARSWLFGCSAIQCKYPNPDAQGKEPADVYDRAVQVLDTPDAPGAAKCPKDIADPNSCGCGGRTGTGWKPRGTSRFTRTFVRLDEDGRAAEGNLYTRGGFQASTVLRTEVVPRSGVMLDPKDEEWLKAPIGVRIGGRRSVLGSAELRPRDSAGTGTGGVGPLMRADGRAIVRLVSPAILVDAFGAPTEDVEHELRRLLGPGVSVERFWTRSVHLTGWHGPSRLPRPAEWALEAGSTWVVSGLPRDAREKLAGGVGLRTTEGYGEVIVGETQAELEVVIPAASEEFRGGGADGPEASAAYSADRNLVNAFVIAVPEHHLETALDRVRNHLRDLPQGASNDVRLAKVTAMLTQSWARDLPEQARITLSALVEQAADPYLVTVMLGVALRDPAAWRPRVSAEADAGAAKADADSASTDAPHAKKEA